MIVKVAKGWNGSVLNIRFTTRPRRCNHELLDHLNLSVKRLVRKKKIPDFLAELSSE